MLNSSLVTLSICRGRIFHTTIFRHIDHGKFFVVIGENDNYVVGFFFINSNIPKSIQAKREFFELQLPVKKEFYPFLNYTSFVGCNDLKRINKVDLEQSIEAGQTTIKGMMCDEDLTLMMDVIRESDVFSDIEKETFFR